MGFSFYDLLLTFGQTLKNGILLKKALFIFSGLFLIGWMSGCEKAKPVCPDSPAYNFIVSFYHVYDSTVTRLKVYNPDMDVDSLTFKEGLSPTVEVPVNITTDSTVFFIDFIDDTLNTVTTESLAFTYDKNIYLNEQQCGVLIDFELKNIYASHSIIDSIAWINKYINKDNEGNLEIYY